MRLLLDAAGHYQCLSEISLYMTRRMRQRHEHLLVQAFIVTNIVFDDRVAAGKAAFIAQPPETVGAVLASGTPIPLKLAVDEGEAPSSLGRRTAAWRR